MAIAVFKSGKRGWRIVERTFENGKRVTKVIPKTGYPVHGFREDMSIEDARHRAKQITKQNLVEKRKQLATARRIEHTDLVNSAYLPELVVKRFEKHLAELTLGMSNRLVTLSKHWSTVQKIIVELEHDPKDFYDNRFQFYNLFIKRQYSLDYIGKILRVLNLWGHFVSRTTNTFYQPIPKPNTNQSQTITEAREDKTGIRRESLPFTVDQVENQRGKWTSNNLSHQWNWLYIASWFGLRPVEVDNLKDQKNWKIENRSNVKVLMVYQTKLTGVKKEKRWKPIPVYLEEQKEALKLIQSGEFKRPLAKTVAKYFGEGFDNYSPRKGFTDIMLEKGFQLEDISLFLGHHSIDTTWQHYKNKQRFKLPTVS